MKSKSLIILLLTIILVSCTNRSKPIQESKDSPQAELTKSSEVVVQLNQNNIRDEIKKKANFFKTDLVPEKDLRNLPEEFIRFSQKFITDSLFQYQHIDFRNLVGAIGECDTTIILNSDNWWYSNWNFIKEFSEGNEYESKEKWDNSVYISNNKIYFEFYLKEIGLIYQIGFEKNNGNWCETLHKIDAC